MLLIPWFVRKIYLVFIRGKEAIQRNSESSPGGSSHGRALGRQSESSPGGSSHGRGRGHQPESSPGGSSHGRALGRQSESSPRGSSHGRGRGHQLESSRGGISHGRGRGHQLESSPGGISHGRGRADTSYGGGGSRPGGQGDLLGDMDTTLQPDFRYGFETTTDHVQSHDGDGFDGDGFDGEDSGGLGILKFIKLLELCLVGVLMHLGQRIDMSLGRQWALCMIYLGILIRLIQRWTVSIPFE
ncbi:hypothetical protein L1987_38746 [Smallanthus sonchifolius]|uniref:Uncharacterized protein n=1 Tax=Smallanthus sonchifolius TaxID=185202 RepID=A0ACB9HL89_9ASTR|nr:hypothetical protein L1987_38746 [Smallanthus sonchifolius]